MLCDCVSLIEKKIEGENFDSLLELELNNYYE